MNKRIHAGILFALIPGVALAEGHGPVGNGVGGHGEVTLVAQVALLMLVGRRRRFLNYLQRSDLERYRTLIAQLGLRR